MPPESEGHAADQRLPPNLRRYREFRRMSQAALARAMGERGWPWHQQTVTKVEAGKQSVSFGEAADLAAILGVSLDRLTWAGAEAGEMALLDRAAALLHQSWEACATAVMRLRLDRDSAGRALASARQSRYERVRQAAAGLAGELEASTLDSATAEGEARCCEEEY